jgi:hypothetical protein
MCVCMYIYIRMYDMYVCMHVCNDDMFKKNKNFTKAIPGCVSLSLSLSLTHTHTHTHIQAEQERKNASGLVKDVVHTEMRDIEEISKQSMSTDDGEDGGKVKNPDSESSSDVEAQEQDDSVDGGNQAYVPGGLDDEQDDEEHESSAVPLFFEAEIRRAQEKTFTAEDVWAQVCGVCVRLEHI